MKQFDFNQQWQFYKEGFEQNTTIINLPHDAQLTETRSADLSMDSGYFPGGKYIYQKQFFCPNEYKDKVIMLEFDGVYMIAEVYINRQQVTFQPNGYSNFIIPIHEHLIVNQDNEIKVVADNSLFPNSRWYTGAGIYRNVVMHVSESNYIPVHGVQIDTLDYKTGKIALHIDETNANDCTVHTNILFNNKIIATTEGFDSELIIPNVQLWNADHPNLYTAHVSLLKNDTVVDEVVETFGIRTIEWSATFGLKVNGNVELLRGGCIHHDNGILGAAAYSDAEDRKVRLLKEAGFNALRSSHNMCSKAILEACDKYGVYMMDEFTDMWTQHKHKYDYATYFKEWYEKDLTSMVSKDYNHPSVIMYSIGNEVSESATPEGIQYAQKMTDLLHKLDSSRPVTCGINLLLNGLTSMGKGLYQDEGMVVDTKQESGSTFVNGVMNKMGGIINFIGRLKKFDLATKDVFAVLDIAGYNYGSGRYSLDPKRYPNRITVGSETLPPYLYKNWQAVKKYPNLIGDFMWTAWDYLGESGLSTAHYGEGQAMLKDYPALLSGAGIIEITGEFRPEVYWAQSVWGLDQKPTIAVEPLTHAEEKVSYGMWRNTDARHSWAWPGYEGKKTTIKVYTSASKVKLFLNNQCISTKAVKACVALFKNIEYKQGTLKAIAYNSSNQQVGEDILVSSKSVSKIKITPEHQTFCDNHLVYVNITLTDSNDIRVYSQEKKVTLDVIGGTLLGYGSAEPVTEDSYLDNVHSTYNGLVQAIIMPQDNIDKITITASAENIQSDMITILKK